MKHKIFLTLPFLALLAFTGCSLVPSASQNSGSIAASHISKSIWKTTDSGTAWQAKDAIDNKPSVSDVNALSMAINPFDTRNIFVGLVSGGILESSDGGDTWHQNIFTADKVYGLAVDPNDGKKIYASGLLQGRGKIWKSEDSGASWKEIYTTASSGPIVIALEMDKKNSGVIYAATSDNNALKSSDAGVSWKNIYVAANPILKFGVDKVNSNLVYFITQAGALFRSKDGGANFEDISKNVSSLPLAVSQGSSNQGFSLIAADPTSQNGVYLAGSGGIVRSRDAGETWQRVSTLSRSDSSPVTALAIDPGNGQEITYAAGQATYKSVDSGANWTTSQFDIVKTISVLRYDPANTTTIYLGFKK